MPKRVRAHDRGYIVVSGASGTMVRETSIMYYSDVVCRGGKVIACRGCTGEGCSLCERARSSELYAYEHESGEEQKCKVCGSLDSSGGFCLEKGLCLGCRAPYTAAYLDWLYGVVGQGAYLGRPIRRTRTPGRYLHYVDKDEARYTANVRR